MLKKNESDSKFTLQVKALITKIHDRTIAKDSLYERAVAFYDDDSGISCKRDARARALLTLQKNLKEADGKDKKLLERQIQKNKSENKDQEGGLTDERITRHKHALSICHEIISLSEGESFVETNNKSAKLLGTIQLISPTSGKKIASINERHKPLYKAVLILRLLDRLCMDDTIPSYIRGYLNDITPDEYSSFAELDPEGYECFTECVKVPLVLSALLQDIGNYHPDAQKILLGEAKDKNPHRALEVEDRKALLHINYRETLKYLIEGIGPNQYVGNSKVERERYTQNEMQKIVFIKGLIKSSIKPKQGYGNLLKVPQIYASIILSTKESYNYKLLPKVYQALYANAERGACSKGVVEALQRITGDFPQGYGVTYIPIDSDGKKCDRFEYAIVNRFYPNEINHPLCRAATRNLTFVSHSLNVEVREDENLYYPETAKSFSSLSKERLDEILSMLASNYVERKKLDLLPRCWDAVDYFSIKINQRLWS